MDYLKNHIDYISLHTYLGNRDNDYYKFLARTTQVDERIKITEGLIKEVMAKKRRKNPIYIAFDEWNIWYRAGNSQLLEEIYNLEDALVVASFLNCFIRNAHIVKIANMAQLVNVIAPMRVDGDKLWLQPTYYPLELFANNCHGSSLDVFVECESYDAGEFKDVPYLDVSSSFNAGTKELVINVVNRHQEKDIETEIISQYGEFAKKAIVYEVNGQDIKTENSAGANNVQISKKEIKSGSDSFTYRFPAHSFTMLKLNMK